MDPFTIGATIFSIGSALFDHSAAKKRAAENASRAQTAYGLNVRGLGRTGIQAQQGAALERFQLGQEGAAASSVAATSAGESGVAGNSVTSLLTQYAAETSFAQSAVDQSLANTMDELRHRKESAFAEYQGRVASVPKPSGLATGLEIGGSLLGFLGSRRGGSRSELPLSKVGDASAY